MNLRDNKKLAGKSVFIIGAANNVGQYISKKFHNEGANVVIADSDPVLLQKLSNELSLRSVLINLSHSSSIKSLANRYVNTDVLVNCMPIELVDINSHADNSEYLFNSYRLGNSIYNAINSFISKMISNGSGSVINIFNSNYSPQKEDRGHNNPKISKDILDSKKFHLFDLFQYGIRCNTIRSAFANISTTPSTDSKLFKRHNKNLELVADLATLFASDESLHLTGLNLNIKA